MIYIEPFFNHNLFILNNQMYYLIIDFSFLFTFLIIPNSMIVLNVNHNPDIYHFIYPIVYRRTNIDYYLSLPNQLKNYFPNSFSIEIYYVFY